MAAEDTYNKQGGGITSPAEFFETVTPDDDNDLVTVSRGVYVGGAGDLVCVGLDDTTFTLVGILAGTLLPIRVKRIKDTLTTATSIVSMA